jgi:hypothetical protein
MDKLSLYALFMFYTTKTLLTDFGPESYSIIDRKIVLKEKAFTDYINITGLNDSSLEHELFNIFYGGKINYPETSIKKLLKTHKYDENSKNTRFIKK